MTRTKAEQKRKHPNSNPGTPRSRRKAGHHKYGRKRIRAGK